MAVRDAIHVPARHALENDGWTITHDPLVVPFGEWYTEIDLGAATLMAAQKGTRKIGVEVKSFLGPSFVNEFHAALGQYLVYREALRNHEPSRRLFMAVAHDTYHLISRKTLCSVSSSGIASESWSSKRRRKR
jgi:hypothetical protein